MSQNEVKYHASQTGEHAKVTGQEAKEYMKKKS